MRKFALAALALSLFAAPALSGPQEDAIAERQAFFKKLGGEMGPLSKLLKGDYDAEAAQTHADNLAEVTKTDFETLSALFVEGTSTADMPGATEASPAIWENQKGFAEKFAALQKAALNLQAEAGKGKAELGAAFGAVGASCKACHDDFRKK